MFHLSEQEKVARLEGEVVMWFRQAQEEHQRAEQMAARVRALNAHIDEMEKAIEKMAEREQDDKDRFEAITEFWHAARKTGYNTSWSIGGITVEALRAETNLALNYKAPATVQLSEWTQIGHVVIGDQGSYRDGELVGGTNRKTPAGILMTPVYAKQSTRPIRKKTTAEKVKGKPKA